MTPEEADSHLSYETGIPLWVKVLATVALVAGAIVLIIVATSREDVVYYKHVDEVVATRGQWQGVKMQLHGQVVPGSVKRRPLGQTHEYRFLVEHGGASVEARYVGILPDTFKEGSDVVLRGVMTKAGMFEVDRGGIVPKCPSKYKARARSQSAGTPPGSGGSPP